MKCQLLLKTLFTQIKVGHWWVSALLWMSLATPSQASVILRIAIERGVNQVTVGSSTTALVKDSTGHTLGQLPAMSSFYASSVPGGVALDKWQSGLFWIEPTGKGFVYIGEHWYRGRTLVVPTEKGLTAVNWVDDQEYLYSVVGGEMDTEWPAEALKAQAVAARTFAFYELIPPNKEGLFTFGKISGCLS